MGQTELAAKSGLTKQRVSQLLKDDRDQIDRIPKADTVQALAQAFDVPAASIWLAIAQALGIPLEAEPVVVREIESASDEQLIRELERRLARGGGGDDENSAAPMKTAAKVKLDSGPEPEL